MQSFEPHPYQQRGIRWILEHPSAGLFLPMGSGKTVTTLTALGILLHDTFVVSRVLIIGPKRVIETTWPDEIQKWQQTQTLRYSIISGTAANRAAAVRRDAEVYLIGKENTQWLIDNFGDGWKWDMIVIDELSTFKNPQSKRFKALRTMMPSVKRFVGLTGTPTPKGIPDLWAQIYLMDQGERLGKTLTQFRQRYLKPEQMCGYTVYKWKVQPGAEKAIQDRIGDICMSIDSAEYASLPDLQVIDLPVNLGADLKKYRDFKRQLVLEVGEDQQVLAANAGVLCGKLLQYTSGQIYTEDQQTATLHGHKLEALVDLMDAANHEPVLIFYWFKHERDRILKKLHDRGFIGLPGETKDAFRRWNDRELDFLLLQPSSAGHGLNLQAGGHIAVWYSLPNWNLELYQQANARLYRQGQKEKVVIYHLLAKYTVDESMLAALGSKSDVQQSMLEALRR